MSSNAFPSMCCIQRNCQHTCNFRRPVLSLIPSSMVGVNGPIWLESSFYCIYDTYVQIGKRWLNWALRETWNSLVYLASFYLHESTYQEVCATGPQLLAVVALSGFTFGTAAWKTKSVISSSVLLEACIVITVTLGLVFDLSKVKSIFSPFLLYAVMEGIPVGNKKAADLQNLEIILNIIVCILLYPRLFWKLNTPPCAPVSMPHFKLLPPPSPPVFLVFSSSLVLGHFRQRIYTSLTCSNIIEERLSCKSIEQERRLCYLGCRGRYWRTYKKCRRINTLLSGNEE